MNGDGRRDAPTRTVVIGDASIEIATRIGPRILSYRTGSAPSPFADLGDESIPYPGGGSFRFVGGHRLWRAPEVPAVTYRPDDAEPEISVDGSTVMVSGRREPDGIVKTIRLSGRGALTVVDHEIANEGAEVVSLAPWAITQLAPNGVAYLPQRTTTDEPDCVQPNRHLVLWPYTDLSDNGFHIGDDFVTVSADAGTRKAKIGQQNDRGWLAFAYGDAVFVVWGPRHDSGRRYYDRGASAQCYRDHRFLELETLGPIADVAPGRRVTHREVWTIIERAGRDVEDVLEEIPDDPGV